MRFAPKTAFDRDGRELRRDDCVVLPTRRTARVLSIEPGYVAVRCLNGDEMDILARHVRRVSGAGDYPPPPPPTVVIIDEGGNR